MKYLIKKFIPPILWKLARKVFGKVDYGYSGDYRNWEEAKKRTSGYDSPEILEKVKEARLKVKRGEFKYERDSVAFNDIEPSWPLLSSLLWIASKNNYKLNILDFGGGLGAVYTQNIEFLNHLKYLKWNIVEQKHYVEAGRRDFEDKHLSFYETIDEVLKENNTARTGESVDIIIFSSVIQYIEEPYKLLDEVVERGFKYILFDRTTISPENKDIITIQKVPPRIFTASFPVWFFDEKKFLNYFGKSYKLVTQFTSLEDPIPLNGKIARHKGYLFQKK